MPTLFIGQNKIELPSVESTNNFAANLIKETNVLDGTVIMADKQTKGRGLAKNTWISAPGENLTCSYVLRPNFLKIEHRFFLSMAVSLALVKVLRSLGIAAIIKWPNDILVGALKISGILIENNIQGDKINSSIVGVGLNVNQSIFEKSLTATSVFNVTGKHQNIGSILELLSSALEVNYLRLKSQLRSEIKHEYTSVLLGYRKQLLFEDVAIGTKFSGEIVDVEDSGELIVKCDSEIRSYLFKEVKFL